MPIYGFHCPTCDKDIELLVGISERPACPTCNTRKLRRLISLPAPQGKSRAIMKSARAQAAREGHLSNFTGPRQRH